VKDKKDKKDTRYEERVPQYVMVQRKYSLCFVEFVRGKYDLRNRSYICSLLERMTKVERDRLMCMSFQELWYGFWNTDSHRSHMKEMNHAADKFNTVRNGYFLLRTSPHSWKVFKTPSFPTNTNGGLRTEKEKEKEKEKETCSDAATIEKVSLRGLLDKCESKQKETEWGFPKGRPDLHEKDITCAVREFVEETTINPASIHVHTDIRPYEEVFTACNNVRYRHVYYLTQMKQEEDIAVEDVSACVDLSLRGHFSQLREVKRISWMDAEGVLSRISLQNMARRQLFEKVHDFVRCNSTLSSFPSSSSSSSSTLSTSS